MSLLGQQLRSAKINPVSPTVTCVGYDGSSTRCASGVAPQHRCPVTHRYATPPHGRLQSLVDHSQGNGRRVLKRRLVALPIPRQQQKQHCDHRWLFANLKVDVQRCRADELTDETGPSEFAVSSEQTRGGIVYAAHSVVVEHQTSDTAVLSQDARLRFDLLSSKNTANWSQVRVPTQ